MAATSAFTNSHFDWEMQPEHTSKEIDSLLDQIEIHLKDQREMLTIPALLFKAFLLVSKHKGKKVDPNTALKTLEEAKKKIGVCKSEEGKIGFIIVHHTLAGKIYQDILGDGESANKYFMDIQGLQNRKTKVSQAYIDVTRAFALSRLGPRKLKESIVYFQKAVNVNDTDADWFFLLGRMIGRNKDYTEGPGDPDGNLSEWECYNKALQLDPKHASSMAFKAQMLSDKKRNPREAECLFNTAITLAPTSMRVLDRAARFYRKNKKWEKAMSCINKIENLGHTTPDAMMYHQKALLFKGKYIMQKNNPHDQRLGKKLPGETTPQSLLEMADTAIDKAIDKSESVDFRFTKAEILEDLGKTGDAESEYRNLMAKREDLESQDVVRIYIKYAFFLKRKHPESDQQMKKRINYLRNAIDLAVKKCVVTGQNCFNKGLWDMKDAISSFEKLLLDQSKHPTSMVKEEALMLLGWLRFTLRNVWNKFAEMTTALDYYQKAYHSCTDATTRKVTTEILNGLIDCYILRDDFKATERCIIELRKFDETGANQRQADWKLAEGLKAGGDIQAHDLLLEAVRCGSIDACEALLRWLAKQPAKQKWQDRFSVSCAEIMHCIKLSQDQMIVLDAQMSELSIHKYIHKTGASSESGSPHDEPGDLVDIEDRKKDIEKQIGSLLDLDNERFGELRRKRLQMELANLSQNSDLIVKCEDVLRVARPLLDHATTTFGQKHYQKSAAYPYIRVGTLTRKTVRDELVQEKLKAWAGFATKHPDLLTFLVQVRYLSKLFNFSAVAQTIIIIIIIIIIFFFFFFFCK